MVKYLILLLFLIIFGCFNCSKDKNPVDSNNDGIESLDTLNNPIVFTIGKKWHYMRYFYYNQYDTCAYPHEIYPYFSYKNFIVTKDTTINSQKGFIVEGTEYDNLHFQIDSFPGRYAVIFIDDTVKVYTLFTTFPNFLLKSKGSFKINASDSLIPIIPLIYPLLRDSSWNYVIIDNNVVVAQRKYLGIEEITVPAGTYSTYKIMTKYISSPNVVNIVWISKDGIVKDSTFWGYSLNNYGDSVEDYEVLYFMGNYNMNPDTLSLIFEITEDAKAFADAHFSHERYKAYYDFIHDSPYNIEGEEPFLKWEIDPFSHDTLYFEDYSEDPDKRTSDYYEMIGKYDEFTQGWDDVDPDMVAGSFQYILDQDFGTDMDYRFRGFAIESIGNWNEENINVDTVWLYLDTYCNERPLYLGKSENQQAFYNMIYKIK